MKYMNRKQWGQFAFVLIPLLFSIIFCFINNGFIFAAAIIFLFLIVGILPVCKMRENLWMFVFSSISLFPANISLALLTSHWLENEMYVDTNFLKITIILIVLHILFCIEQITLGVLTRFIWRRQYKVEVE